MTPPRNPTGLEVKACREIPGTCCAVLKAGLLTAQCIFSDDLGRHAPFHAPRLQAPAEVEPCAVREPCGSRALEQHFGQRYQDHIRRGCGGSDPLYVVSD